MRSPSLSLAAILRDGQLERQADHPLRFGIGNRIRPAEIVDLFLALRREHRETLHRLLRIAGTLLDPLLFLPDAPDVGQDLGIRADLFDNIVIDVRQKRRGGGCGVDGWGRGWWWGRLGLLQKTGNDALERRRRFFGSLCEVDSRAVSGFSADRAHLGARDLGSQLNFFTAPAKVHRDVRVHRQAAVVLDAAADQTDLEDTNFHIADRRDNRLFERDPLGVAALFVGHRRNRRHSTMCRCSESGSLSFCSHGPPSANRTTSPRRALYSTRTSPPSASEISMPTFRTTCIHRFSYAAGRQDSRPGMTTLRRIAVRGPNRSKRATSI